MIILILSLLIILLWWPLPKKNEWALYWTGLLLILIGGQIGYPKVFTAFSLGVASLLIWLESIRAILVRHFSTDAQLLKYNQKTVVLMLLNLFICLPLLFKHQGDFPWFNHQVILTALIVNGITTLGLVIFWGAVITIQLLSRPVKADYLIVLGAGLRHGKVPPVLAARLQQAVACWNLNRNATIIVTGGILRGEKLSEAKAMAKYLTTHGIPQDRIVLEEQAMNTWDNLQKCQKLLQKQAEPKQKIIVVTSSFHAFRAYNYLRKLKLSWSIVSSNTPWKLQPLTVIRDYLGIIRDHYRSWLAILFVLLVIAELVGR
ncbi:YdcF family protein [Limosilactobacillus urinaemulieris]|uniref:YdcF family protein n=1 Tax=Limosilactobacillus urinaemulieris TaxID=2742600 RepID=UPI0028E83D89|nr:YdcF family protein [Limosilactobacillus urinaemulieris]